MNADSLTDDVLLLLGEDPGQCPWHPGGDTAGCSLRMRIMREIEPCAARAVADTPHMELTGWRRLPADGLKIDADGRAMLPLPDDFLLFFSLRMTSWQRPAGEVLAQDSWLRRLQGNRWHGLRGTPQRPLAFMAVDDEGRRCMELFSCPQGDTLAEGWYMPAPAFDADRRIEIPPAAYSKCLDYIVETLRM